MALVPMDAFEEGTEIVRVYLAATLAEAQAAERVLTAAGVDYAVEVEDLPSRTPFGLLGTRRGAGLWVRAAAVDAAADALERAGQVAGLVDRGAG
ncbi:MAG TPA: hypothetical protein VFL83_01835 [Anaeromyxobacter sp.]|nr:hypothetical protein [Anaeromyxobacter sp.]